MSTPNETPRGVCPYCGKRLVPIVIDICGEERIPAYRRCDCDAAREEEMAYEREEAARREREEAANLARKYRSAGIPKKYWEADADDAEHIEALKRGQGLFFTGLPGRGKTYTACSIARRLIDEGLRVRFGDIETIEREVKAAWNSRETSEAEVILKYANADVAIIDDLGAETITPTTMKVLRSIISEREANDAVTLFTSNYDRREFAKHIAEKSDRVMAQRLASRIAGMTELVVFEGEDRRLAK